MFTGLDSSCSVNHAVNLAHWSMKQRTRLVVEWRRSCSLPGVIKVANSGESRYNDLSGDERRV